MAMEHTLTPEINRSFVGGAILIALLVGGGILLSGDVAAYMSISSIFIVLGGTVGATLIHYSAEDLSTSFKALRCVMFQSSANPIKRIQLMVRIAQEARQQGNLILEEISKRIPDPFLKKGLEVTVDGQEAQVIRKILETEMRTSSEVAQRGTLIFQTMGTYAPAMGLIGTLLGLVQMMKGLQDPSTVGPSMAVALLTTLYGAVLANLVFMPLAGKIKNRAEEEVFIKNITLEGIISIRAGENPIVLEQRLESYLAGVKKA